MTKEELISNLLMILQIDKADLQEQKRQLDLKLAGLTNLQTLLHSQIADDDSDDTGGT